MDSPSHPGRPHGGHEQTDVKLRPIVVLSVILAVASVISFVVAVVMFDVLEQRQEAVDTPPSPLAVPNPLPPEPRLQRIPQLELEAYLQRDRDRLEKYQWIDQDGKVLRIPVERAMELLLERGIPPVQPAAEQPAP